MDGSNAGADKRGDTPRRRIPAPVAGAAAAVGAVSLGLVLIGACGLGNQDVYVAPPALNADLQAAPETSQSGTTTPVVIIPPSPTWRVATEQSPRHSAPPSVTTDPDDPGADPSAPSTSRTTTTRSTTTTTRRTTTTTEPAAPTTEPTRATTEPAIAAVPTTDRPDDQASGGQ
ncbi:hypothetical protein [Nocardia sp. NPDC006630]|uniref:hypothetical protein n=1 Tax=Nocardia sp. NPDC006630 TaxID=3157181 RepID=UPI0033BF8249